MTVDILAGISFLMFFSKQKQIETDSRHFYIILQFIPHMQTCADKATPCAFKFTLGDLYNMLFLV